MRKLFQLVGVGVLLLSHLVTGEASSSQQQEHRQAQQKANINANAGPCPTNKDIIGYTSLSDINKDQATEWTRILEGKSKVDPIYSFVLCPETIFDLNNNDEENRPLEILLSGTVISCGNEMDAKINNNCIIRGGKNQIILKESTDNEKFPLESIAFIGITFDQFTGTSLDIIASDILTISLIDVAWKVCNFKEKNKNKNKRQFSLFKSFDSCCSVIAQSFSFSIFPPLL